MIITVFPMKSVYLLLVAGAAVMLGAVSCAKTEIIRDEAPVEMSFKAVTNLPSKADPELSGASLGTDNDYVIYAAASPIPSCISTGLSAA